jgi:hypothetical protein
MAVQLLLLDTNDSMSTELRDVVVDLTAHGEEEPVLVAMSASFDRVLRERYGTLPRLLVPRLNLGFFSGW